MMTRNSNQVIAKRYLLKDQLGAGGMGVVFRATDRLTGQDVALKRVTIPTVQLMFQSRVDTEDNNLALAKEFKALATLRHPNIISVLDYGFDEERNPFFTMDLLEDAQTILEAGQDKPTREQIDLLIQLLQALVYLHRRGILHRDLKPSNVLVVDGKVRVLDFGLSIITERSIEEVTESTGGTLHYMAPELFRGGVVSKASDLYAVGVMAYELIAGRYPFDTSNVAVLINDILITPVNVSSIGVGGALERVLERLLVKSREERYGEGNQVIRDICAAQDRPLPLETAEIRESFLQAAKFVDREKELGTLTHMVRETMGGNGSAWLVGGESGVGKSRLLEELRTLALVEGAHVVTGQAVREGGAPYHSWREVLRRLAMTTDLNDEHASVIKALVPDIGVILDREVLDAPPLDPQSEQIRLFRVVEEIFTQIGMPIVVILEDLQWIGSNSLALMARMIARVKELPLMLIGNYRDDERPDLPQELRGITMLGLKRFTEQDVTDLSVSMLGAVGREQKVINLLQRETEGNPFFLVETLRVLAEEAGQLDGIGRMKLPDKVFAGGVEEIVQHRLSMIPLEAKPLLEFAAIAGRELDLDVLQVLEPQVSLNEWLNLGSDVAVLDVRGGSWRFTHDKIRQGLLDQLKSDERQSKHRKVAEAIESVHKGAPEHYATLAHLWGVAEDRSKELYYCKLAGEQTVRNSANVEAVGYFKRALDLLESEPDGPEKNKQELSLQAPLAVALMNLRGYGDSEVGQAFTRAHELYTRIGEAPEPVLNGLWAFYFVRAEFERAVELAEQILLIANKEEDPTYMFLVGHNAQAANLSMMGQLDLALEHAKQVRAIYNPQKHRSFVYTIGQDLKPTSMSWIAFDHWLRGYPDLAKKSIYDALALARDLAHPYTLCFVLFYAALVNQFCREVEAANEAARELCALSKEFGFFWYLLEPIYSGWSQAMLGQYAEGAAQIYQGLQMFRVTGSEIFQPYFLSITAEAYGKASQIRDGLDAVNEGLTRVEQTGERFYEAEIHRIKGELLRMQGVDDVEVEKHFHNALSVAREQNAKSLELRTTLNLVRLWREQGKTEKARQMLEEIYSWFTEGFDTLDLRIAKALLDELQ